VLSGREGKIRRSAKPLKTSGKDADAIFGRDRAGDVFVPEKLVPKLKRFWRFKKQRSEELAPDAPLLCAQSRRRLSKRRIQFAWREWQKRAGFDRLYPFHALRHSSVTNVYRQTRNLFLAQRFARHASPLTTTVYTHPSDDEMWQRMKSLSC
jgi:site-specific recombinase XerC